MLLKLLGSINFIVVLSRSINIEEKESNFDDFVKQNNNNKTNNTHSRAREQIAFKLCVIIDTVNIYSFQLP